MIEVKSLVDALGAADVRMVTFVGAGGKTSAIVRAAAELAAGGRTVITTTTTLVGRRLPSCGAPVLARDGVDGLRRALASSRAVFLYAGERDDGKFTGVAPELLDMVAGCGVADCILVEGDGARGLPIKMPDEHEPVIPSASDIVVPVVGMDALDRSVVEGSVHRPNLLARLATGDRITPGAIVALLSSTAGGMKNVPLHAMVRPLLNKVGLPGGDRATDIAESLLRAGPDRLDRVLCADVQDGAIRVFQRHEERVDRGPDARSDRS